MRQALTDNSLQGSSLPWVLETFALDCGDPDSDSLRLLSAARSNSKGTIDMRIRAMLLINSWFSACHAGEPAPSVILATGGALVFIVYFQQRQKQQTSSLPAFASSSDKFGCWHTKRKLEQLEKETRDQIRRAKAKRDGPLGRPFPCGGRAAALRSSSTPRRDPGGAGDGAPAAERGLGCMAGLAEERVVPWV